MIPAPEFSLRWQKSLMKVSPGLEERRGEVDGGLPFGVHLPAALQNIFFSTQLTWQNKLERLSVANLTDQV
jgi:hypothetical protein